MHIDKNIILRRKDNKPIVIDTFFKDKAENQPIVIFSHGYKGFKNWGAWDIMAKQIANTGYCVIKFNFSHNGGTIEQPIDFPDLEAFGNNNYTKELDDLSDVIDWSIDNFSKKSFVNTQEIYLIGHSRGSGISILKSAEDNRITKLITLASLCDFGSRSATVGDVEQWRKDGVKYVINGRTKQKMPHYFQFYEDYQNNKERLDIECTSRSLSTPHLIIHGDKDLSISSSEAELIHQWSNNSKLSIIKNANHVFNVSHPCNDYNLTFEFETIIQTVLDFLK